MDLIYIAITYANVAVLPYVADLPAHINPGAELDHRDIRDYATDVFGLVPITRGALNAFELEGKIGIISILFGGLPAAPAGWRYTDERVICCYGHSERNPDSDLPEKLWYEANHNWKLFQLAVCFCESEFAKLFGLPSPPPYYPDFIIRFLERDPA